MISLNCRADGLMGIARAHPHLGDVIFGTSENQSVDGGGQMLTLLLGYSWLSHAPNSLSAVTAASACTRWCDRGAASCRESRRFHFLNPDGGTANQSSRFGSIAGPAVGDERTSVASCLLKSAEVCFKRFVVLIQGI